MSSIHITLQDNTGKTLEQIQKTKLKALESCGLVAESYAKQECPVDTGRLRNSITHSVQEDACYIGTNVEYAAYVELGTGIYYAGGRQTPWVFQDSQGNWHMTHGQRAQPYLKPAVADHSETYRKTIEDCFKNA